MLNKTLLLTTLLMSAGCYNGCITPMPVVSCGGYDGESWPAIAYYQKPATLGRTDSAQRWRDVVACGATYGDESLRSAIAPSPDSPIEDTMIEKFDNCMAERGYIYIMQSIDCGTQDPEEDTGKCNL